MNEKMGDDVGREFDGQLQIPLGSAGVAEINDEFFVRRGGALFEFLRKSQQLGELEINHRCLMVGHTAGEGCRMAA